MKGALRPEQIDGLSLREARACLQGRVNGAVLAPNRLGLLEHPRVDLGTLERCPPIAIRSEASSFSRHLDLSLRQAGINPATRMSLVAELGHLARLVASLSGEPQLDLEIRPSLSEGDIVAGRAGGHVVALAQRLERDERNPHPGYADWLGRAMESPPRTGRRALLAWGPADTVSSTIREVLGASVGPHAAEQRVVILSAPSGERTTESARRASPPDLTIRDRHLARTPLVLVSAPFAPLEYPSLGLSTLRASLDERPPVLYLSLPFAKAIGPAVYDWIAAGRPSFPQLLGEWIFSHALEGTEGDDGYLRNVLCRETLDWLEDADDLDRPVTLVPAGLVVEAADMIDRARSAIETWSHQIAALDCDIVGFTSVFQQNTASLALARKLKRERPGLKTVFGGANWEGEMGRTLLETYPFVDVAVSGEADSIFPKLVSRLLHGADPGELQGVSHRDNGSGSVTSEGSGATRVALDRLPIPDYRDFFAQWRDSGLDGWVRPRLLFESSRGCWWGEKSHCTFCGLNGESMAFRSKTPERVLREIDLLTETYPDHELAAVDNILSMEYFTTVMRDLAARGRDLSLFYEIKANLTRTQVAQLRAAGVTRLQPGIESFSDDVLRLMGKGATALQNVQLLKWCTEEGIVASWNLLWGFPGETVEHYRQMGRLVPLLTHLTPPAGAGRIRLDRFSPNHIAPGEHGFKNVRAARAYRHIYRGLAPETLDRIAYYFDSDYVEPRPAALDDAVIELWRALETWGAEHSTSRLVHFPSREHLLVFDSRSCAVAEVHSLGGAPKKIFEACDRATSLRRLQGIAGAEADGIVEDLVSRHLLIRVGDSCLTPSLSGRRLDARLAVDVPDRPPPPAPTAATTTRSRP